MQLCYYINKIYNILLWKTVGQFFKTVRHTQGEMIIFTPLSTQEVTSDDIVHNFSRKKGYSKKKERKKERKKEERKKEGKGIHGHHPGQNTENTKNQYINTEN